MALSSPPAPCCAKYQKQQVEAMTKLLIAQMKAFIHNPPNMKYQIYYICNQVCVTSANGLLPVPLISPTAYTYAAVQIHQNQRPAKTMAVTQGTNINKK
ncbi:unnamed protein product [Paramecium octaurelia]|uniref:Uncharacterized protein n=1 Tax=Paramecium octaurelia TaxID=43137 RepID=A0A8S1W897_PAROT|nr:unnamed protein product [Paramecium octaurelia]